MHNRLMLIKHLLLALTTAISYFSMPLFSDAEEYQYETDIVSDNTPISVDSVSTGAATYKVPIEVPPGRKGVQPNISLTYNSYAKNGWIGAGWDLDLGSIQRSTKRGVDYGGSDYLAGMNGTSSELVYRSDWNDGSGYFFGAKIEGSFTKYCAYYNSAISDYSWIAYAKDGTKYYFGTTNNSRQENSYGTFKYCLDKVIDTNSNTMYIAYQDNNNQYYSGSGQIYPYAIYYTGNEATGLSTNKAIYFEIETRTDPQISYQTKTETTISKRLKTIHIYTDSVLTRKYELSYGNNNPYTNRSRITQVQTIGYKNGTADSSIPPIKFTYYNGGNKTFAPSETTYINNLTGDIRFGDINGDGNTDFIKLFSLTKDGETGIKIYGYPFLSNGYGTFEKLPLVYLGSSTFCKAELSDVTGDGKADIVAIYGSGSVHTYKSLGNKFQWLASTSGSYSQRIISVDLNGDGKADVVRNNLDLTCVNGNCTQTIYTSLSNGETGTFGTSMSQTVKAGATYVVDVTGDGYPDMIKYDSQNYKLYSYKSNGDGTFASTYSSTTVKRSSQTFLADINGDGMADILQSDSDTSGWTQYLYYCLAKGDGTFTSQNSTSLGIEFCLQGVADFNGDGLADLYLIDFDGSINHRYIALSKGNGTFNSPTYIGDYCSATKYFLDVNGDGMADDLDKSQSCICVSLSKYATGDGPADFLKTVTNEYNGTTTLTYGNSSDFLNNLCPFIVHPLTNKTTTDSYGVSSPTSLSYTKAKYDYTEREFWGFNTVTQTNPNGTKAITYYYQDKWKKGKPYYVYNYDKNGTTLRKKTTLTWSTYPSTPSTYAFVKLTQKDMEITESSTVKSREVYTYDDTNGNLSTTVSSDQTTGTTAETVTTANTWVNKGTWVWRVESESITGSNTGTVRQMDYTYYATTGNLYTTKSGGTSGIITETNTYNSYGNLLTTKDANLNITTYSSYDTTYTYPTTITYPSTTNAYDSTFGTVNHVESMTWDNNFGKMITRTDQNGNDTGYTYDGHGRVTAVTNYQGLKSAGVVVGEVLYSYPTSATTFPRYVIKNVKEASNSYVPSYEYYDGFGRVIQTTTKGETSYVTTRLYYDNMGRNDLAIGPFFTTGNSYNSLSRSLYASYTYLLTSYDYSNRPLTVKSPGESGEIETSYAYSGFWTTITDPDGNEKVEIKDYLGRVVEVQEDDDDGGTTLYTYNAAGDLRTVEDEYGNTTTINYNALGRKINMTDPDMGYWQYTSYDGNGNLLTQKDAKNQIMTFVYDQLNRMIHKSYSTSDPTVTYVYDNTTSGANGKGLLYSVSNGNVITKNYSYDAMGRVLNVKKAITGDSERTTLYGYDNSGKVVSMTYPGSYVVTNTYYAGSNLLYQVKNGSTALATISNYKPTGKMGTLTYANGTTTTYTYDAESTRLTGMLTQYGTSTILQNRNYTYYDSGDIYTIIDSAPSTPVTYTYIYDDLHRLKTETSGGAYSAQTVNYNAIGNITSKIVGSNTLSYTYNTTSIHKHAVDSVSVNGGTAKAFAYDANGNMTSGWDFTTPSSPVQRTITWNADNMPYQITEGTSTSTLLYDGSGARAKKTVGTTTTYYIGEHFEKQGATEYKYIFAGNMRIAQIAGSTVSYFHKDHLGSSTVMTNSSGTQIESSNYEPFGGMRVHTGTTTSNYKFTDQELDAENGLYNYDARLYDPVIGRFITPDMVVPDQYNPQSLNRYSYCENNPLIYTDPSGHWNSQIHFGSEKWGGTMAWAMEMGFSRYAAEIIAFADNGVDSGSTGPMPWQDPSRHFNTNTNALSGSPGDSRFINAGNSLQKAVDLARNGNLYGALVELGKGLHSLQDMYAHTDAFVSRFYGIYNHVFAMQADDPTDDMSRTNNTRQASYQYMTALIVACMGNGGDLSDIFGSDSSSQNTLGGLWEGGYIPDNNSNYSAFSYSSDDTGFMFSIPSNCDIYVDGQPLYR